ncbi:hypothetical protein PILCRDRAFT_824769, partial [Piloderma croceum F 1598]
MQDPAFGCMFHTWIHVWCVVGSIGDLCRDWLAIWIREVNGQGMSWYRGYEGNGQVGSRYPDRHPAAITSHLRTLPQVASSFHLPVD